MTEEVTKLNPSIVIMKTGEKLITILQEAFEGEGEQRRGICLLMNYPYELTMINTPSEDVEQELQVKYSKWCPYAVDSQYRIPYDSVMTIGSPDPGLATAYYEKISILEEKKKAAEEQQSNWKLQQEEVEKVINGTAEETPVSEVEVV